MPRNASGTYTLPSGNPVVSGNVIEATWANNTLSDVGTEITGSLARNGAGGMLGALRNTDGTVNVPSISFTNETTTGFYRAGSSDVRLSIAGADAYGVTSTTFTISKNLSYTGTLTGGAGVINIGGGQIYKDASGYVGFGTSSPVSRVTIKGPTNATALQQLAFEYHGNTSKFFALGLQNVSGNAQIMAGSGASLIFYTNSDLDSTNERLRIDTSGNIKIAGLTSSTALALDSNNNIVSVTNTGTGNNVLATSPTLVTPALGTPTSGTLTNCTGLPISTGVSGLGANVATFLASPTSANLAAAVTNETGTGSLVFATSPTLVTPILGTPTSGTLTNCTGLPLSTGVTGTLGAANGGTGTTGFASNRIPYSNGTSLTSSTNLTYDGTTLNAAGVNIRYPGGGADNIAIGWGGMSSGAITSAGYDIAIGASALFNVTSGSYDIALGYQTLVNVTSGNRNTSVGVLSGQVITTGSNNTIIGALANASAAGASYQVVVGDGLTAKGDNTAYIGGSSGAYNQKNVTTWETTSDARIKKNIVDNTQGLDVIKQIRVRNFEYRSKEEITELTEHSVIEKPGVQLGVIAQEFQQVLPECVTENSTGVLSVTTDPLVWYLINAVKQLSAEIESLKAK